MMKLNNILKLFLLLGLFYSCEQAYTPPASEDEAEIVIEGYIEAGQGAGLTYVLVTKTLPFLTTISASDFQNLFVSNASVSVKSDGAIVQLSELCLNELPEDVRRQAAQALGLDPDNTSANICAYVDLFGQIQAAQGKTYDLTVIANGKTITASTTIPNFVGLDSFRFTDLPGEPNDTLAQLLVTINDPIGNNFYRYFTAEGTSQLIAPSSSVTDDTFFDGKKFEFPLTKAEARGTDFDPNSFGYYTRGDSVSVKWCGIDKAHFDFWNTRDRGANSGGPFSSYIRIKSNINGGLGIWGGYAVGVYDLYCPEK